MRLALTAVLVTAASSLLAQSPYVAFEGSQTDPVAVSEDGLRLFALDTAGSRLTVWSLADASNPVLLREIRAGLEPTSLALHGTDEVWVVDQLGDCVHVISLDAGAITATIRVGDEPGGVAFAGAPERAFVSCTTDRRVDVIDPVARAVVGQVPIFADDPKAIRASRDGATVWVGSFRSGNRTTIVPALRAPLPPPPTNTSLPPAPRQGILVDSTDPAWAANHGITLPDLDVHAIDANTLQVAATYPTVGTILFAIAERPGHAGEIWVANTDARNLVRFEPNLRGHAIDSRVTRIGATGTVTPFDLNVGIDYGTLPNPQARATALSQPTGVTFSPDGTLAYVAAFGTDRIGVLDAASGSVIARIDLAPNATPRQKRGTRALVHHPTAPRLYALNRLASSLTVVDTANLTVLAELAFTHDPTPIALEEGRGFLYDAKLSGNGTMACASCHIDSTTDNLAWDLGDPGGQMFVVRDQFNRPQNLHPMKGPMLTQTLQGLQGHQPFHWRGDKPLLQDFNPAFDKLLGGAQLATQDMDDYAAFMQSIVYPSNPNLGLDGSMSALAQQGRTFFLSTQFAPGVRCVDCHAVTRGSNGQVIDSITLGNRPEAMKVAQLRNIYKRGGKQVRAQGRTSGFGHLHDGEFDSVAHVLTLAVFGTVAQNATFRAQLDAFANAFDTGTSPAVGFAKSFAAGSQPNPLDPEILTLIARGRASQCDVIGFGTFQGESVGFLLDRLTGDFVTDRSGDPAITLAQLFARVANGEGPLTIAGVPFRSGTRLGIDRDLDTRLDGDERPTSRGTSTPTGAGLRLSTNSPMAVGNPRFAFVLDGAPPGALGILALGGRRAAMPVLGFDLLVNPFVTASLAADARGTATLPVGIPADPSLAGIGMATQAVMTGVPATPFGFAASRALDVRIDAP